VNIVATVIDRSRLLTSIIRNWMWKYGRWRQITPWVVPGQPYLSMPSHGGFSACT
jgi:hypothetical protein